MASNLSEDVKTSSFTTDLSIRGAYPVCYFIDKESVAKYWPRDLLPDANLLSPEAHVSRQRELEASESNSENVDESVAFRYDLSPETPSFDPVLSLNVYSQKYGRLLTHEEVLKMHVLRDLDLRVRLQYANEDGDCSDLMDEISPCVLEAWDVLKGFRSHLSYYGSLLSRSQTGFRTRLPLSHALDLGLHILRAGQGDKKMKITLHLTYKRHVQWTIEQAPLITVDTLRSDESPFKCCKEVLYNGIFVSRNVFHGPCAMKLKTKDPEDNSKEIVHTFEIPFNRGIYDQIFVWFEDSSRAKLRPQVMEFSVNGFLAKSYRERDILERMAEKSGLYVHEPIYALLDQTSEYIQLNDPGNITFGATFDRTFKEDAEEPIIYVWATKKLTMMYR